MSEYDSEHFDPPAPVAHVTLRNPATGDVLTNIPMLIDTGADVTLVPSEAVTKLGIKTEENKAFEVQGYNGETTNLKSARLDLLFLNKTFKGEYLLTNRSIGILGRNILNKLRILFDGMRGEWKEEK
ncbi:MAG: retroviral-like aspartic protease [Anaerolineae bacterium]|nr:retroviral-like aspartic protease [Anaerolineae bacterium]